MSADRGRAAGAPSSLHGALLHHALLPEASVGGLSHLHLLRQLPLQARLRRVTADLQTLTLNLFEHKPFFFYFKRPSDFDESISGFVFHRMQIFHFHFEPEGISEGALTQFLKC